MPFKAPDPVQLAEKGAPRANLPKRPGGPEARTRELSRIPPAIASRRGRSARRGSHSENLTSGGSQKAASARAAVTGPWVVPFPFLLPPA
ncbi:hypothetical protein AcidC75_27750 [Acidisoma sp. C75]